MARGVLELIWDSCYESGDEAIGTTQDIETLVQWTGEPGALVDALAGAGAPTSRGFIELVSSDGEPTYRVHDLWHHAPEYVQKRRKRELERRQKVRPTGRRRRTAPHGGQRPPLSDWQTGDGETPSPSPSPAPVAVQPSPAHSPAPDGEAPGGRPRFDRFWESYPKRVGKGDAERAFAKHKPTEALLMQMLKALAWQVGQPDWLKEGGKYIPNPSTWLNQRRWEDEPFVEPSGRPPDRVSRDVRALCDAAGLKRYDVENWLAGAFFQRGRTDGLVTLAIPDADAARYVSKHFSEALEAAVVAKGGSRLVVVAAKEAAAS